MVNWKGSECDEHSEGFDLLPVAENQTRVCSHGDVKPNQFLLFKSGLLPKSSNPLNPI